MVVADFPTRRFTNDRKPCGCVRCEYHDMPDGLEGKVIWRLAKDCAEHAKARAVLVERGFRPDGVLSDELMRQING